MSGREIKIFSSIEDLNRFAREEIARIGNEAIGERGVFTIALSGGSTPKKLYEMLAAPDFQNRLNWHQTHFFFGDERFVPPDSTESNFRMAQEALFSKIDVPAQNIHRFLTEAGEPQQVAEKMENSIREFFGLATNEFPRFDLILLGMGADGHTASLFPMTAALDETRRVVTENYVEKFQAFRLTFTFPALNHARHILFLIAGEDKAAALGEILQNEPKAAPLPAGRVRPEDGSLKFLVDEKAASLFE